METVDLEFLDTAQQFIQRAAGETNPSSFNSPNALLDPYPRRGLSGGFYNDAMVGHDNLVGRARSAR